MDLTEEKIISSDLVNQIQYLLYSEEVNEVDADEVKVGFIGIIKCSTIEYISEKTMKASASLVSVMKKREEVSTDPKRKTKQLMGYGFHL